MRGILTQKGWRGYPGGDTRLWLTEGGAQLNAMPGWVDGADSSSDQANAKRQQAISLGAAASALKRDFGPGEGVVMFTQFLFHARPVNEMGICNQFPEPPATPEPPEAYERPAYEDWKQFRYVRPS